MDHISNVWDVNAHRKTPTLPPNMLKFQSKTSLCLYLSLLRRARQGYALEAISRFLTKGETPASFRVKHKQSFFDLVCTILRIQVMYRLPLHDVDF
jgi:hypothetical protein